MRLLFGLSDMSGILNTASDTRKVAKLLLAISNTNTITTTPNRHHMCSVNMVYHALGFYTFSPCVLMLNKFHHKDPGHCLGGFALYFLFAGN